MTLTSIAGQDIWVARKGTDDPHWLMLHCTLARHEALLRLAGGLPGRATLCDWPSHGRSADAPRDGGDLHDLCTDIATALVEPETHLLGHSFGGTVALRVALTDARVRSLTLVEPVLFSAAVGAPGYLQHEKDYAPAEEAMAAGDMEQAARAFLDIWGAGIPWEALPDRMRQETMRAFHYIPESASALHHDSAGLLAPGRLEALEIPVTLISGSLSHPVVQDIHAELARRLPQARQITIDGAGHMVPITHPGAVANAILSPWESA